MDEPLNKHTKNGFQHNMTGLYVALMLFIIIILTWYGKYIQLSCIFRKLPPKRSGT